jgi:hypothetical protein
MARRKNGAPESPASPGGLAGEVQCSADFLNVSDTGGALRKV